MLEVVVTASGRCFVSLYTCLVVIIEVIVFLLLVKCSVEVAHRNTAAINLLVTERPLSACFKHKYLSG